jgi:Rrf2 family protein
VRIPARSDYALRAMVAIAGAGDAYVKAVTLSDDEAIPLEFLQHILRDLRRAGLLFAQRGYEGGYRLAQPAREITVSAVLQAVGSPLTEPYEGAESVWDVLEATASGVLGSTTLADLVAR